MSDNYHRFLSKKKEILPEESAKLSARDAFGIVMISHGEEFGDDSAFGASLRRLVDEVLVLRVQPDCRNVSREIWSRDVQACYVAGDPGFNLQRHFLLVTQNVSRRDQGIPRPKEET